ncbi:IPT/TIG domain-containing protein [Nocardioides immobilis]|uniref:IPT/TIG domain-containing protein n=1 Tax=Nocardioides immobilis TaxID=2049295 RepID=UPI0015FE598B|nr:IPT/TIG domain-containing protein [Nocardioides immobilis]
MIDGSGGPGATYATVTGAGQIDNRGRILLPTEKVTAGGVTVTGRHYAISFDTQGGSGVPDPVTVFADTFDNGARSFPTNPTKPGATFAGWNSAADGSGARVTATRTLRGSSLGGTPVPITAYAQWLPVPAITAIAPSSGPIEGGTSVVITGTGFTGATKVTFGKSGQAASFTVDSATQITAISPASATTGARAITVTTAAGRSAYVDAGRFTYTAPAPAITAIAPSSGPIEGGTSVVITGTGFTGATKVGFGQAGQAASFTVDSATQITAISPASATTGARAITVTTAAGRSAYVDAGRFTYTAPAPAITAIAPSSGPIEGGTSVVITGTGFTGATRVVFGQAGPATSFTVDSATQITAISPASATTGARAITVTTAGGRSAYVDAGRFTYTAPAPAITGIAPSSGPIEGGTSVVITGTGFTGATKVVFGTAGPATSFTVDSATQITAISPPSATTGVRAITVTTVGGPSAYVDAGRFTYTAPAPAITAIAPSSGPLSGGTTVVITGTAFTGATKVVFGQAGPATSFTVDSATRITAISPPSATAGARAITVTTVGGPSAYVDAGRFTYVAAPAITAIAPSSGPLNGGTSVVITGTGFTGATKVTFGDAGPATSFTVDSATQITATSPAASDIGARHVSVSTVGGANAEVEADLFTYTAVITRVVPSAGPMSGGTSVVITGTGFTGATAVTFGDAGPATSFTVDSATQITATSPAASDTGARNIRVTTADGEIPAVNAVADRFTYTDPPDACGDLLVKDDGSTWTCSFVDDFDGQSLDTTKWGVQQSSITGFRTGETCYVNSPENIAVRNGELLLTARREAQNLACDSTLGSFSTPYTGGMVGTRGKFSQTYGRFEVRAKYPAVTVAGLHGGFWTMPRTNTYGVWPASGELDIAEWWSNAPTQVLPTLHYTGDSLADSGWNCRVSTPSSYHTYTMEWYPDVVRFFIDGEMCFERSWTPTGLIAPQPFDKPFSMILNMGVGSLSGGNKVSADTPLPATYTVDYAKVWR